MTAEREKTQQELLAAEEEHRQLKLTIDAHRARAVEELEAAKAKEVELQAQEEVRKKCMARITSIDVILDT